MKIVFAIVNVWSIFINNEKELLFTRIFYKGRREKSESAGDSAFDGEIVCRHTGSMSKTISKISAEDLVLSDFTAGRLRNMRVRGGRIFRYALRFHCINCLIQRN